MARDLPSYVSRSIRDARGAARSNLVSTGAIGAMATVWIVHRDAARRAALLRLTAAADALVGAPGDRVFESGESPQLVVLGVGGDFEAELEFAHRRSPRLGSARWVLVCDAADREETRRLFDTLPAEILAWPPDALTLRRRLVEAKRTRRADRLSERRSRDALAARFARWFGDLQLPELLRALDPQLARVPLLVRGEAGTGRSVLARYAHAFGGTTGGAFVAVDCARLSSIDEISEGIARASRQPGARHALTVCLEHVDRLAPALAHELLSWIELAPPPDVLHPTSLRWIGTAPPAGLDADLALVTELAGITIHLPPLRERPHLIASLVADVALSWCHQHGQRPRRFSSDALDALREYPWPGNVRELEGVVLRALSADAVDPVPASSLRFVDIDAAVMAQPAAPDSAAREGMVGQRSGSENRMVNEPRRATDPGANRASSTMNPRTAVAHPAPDAPARLPRQEDDDSEALARRFVGAVAHEIRNPLVPIRTLAQLLPQHFDDPEFRERFAQQVGSDVERITETLDRMAGFAALGPPEPRSVDIAALLDALLDARRDEIRERRLLVLKELDRTQPNVPADPEHLRFAFGALLDKALSWMPERGDLYLASKHHSSLLRGLPSVRILVRFHSPLRIAPLRDAAGVSVTENALEVVIAETLIRGLGGRLTIDSTDGDETVVVVDLPA